MRRASPILKLGTSFRIASSSAAPLLANISPYQVSVWDIGSRSKIARLRNIKHASGVTLSGDGQRLAVKNVLGTLGVYDLTSLHLRGNVQPTSKEGADPVFSPDDQFIVDADWDGVIRLINAATLDVTDLRRYADCMVTDIDHMPGADRFTFLVMPKRVGTPVFSSAVLLEWRYPFDHHAPVEHETGFQWIYTARMSPNGESVAVLCGEPEGYVVQLLDGTFEHVTARSGVEQFGGGWTHALAWSRDGRHLAVVRHNKVELLDVPSLAVIHEIELAHGCCVDFTSDGAAMTLGSGQSGYYMPLPAVWTTTRLR